MSNKSELVMSYYNGMMSAKTEIRRNIFLKRIEQLDPALAEWSRTNSVWFAK